MPLLTDWLPGDQFTAEDLNAIDESINMLVSAVGLRPARNTIAAIGDSITFGAFEIVGYQPTLGSSHIQQLEIMTHQRIRFGANFAISGSNLSNALTVQLPKVLAMNPLPGACVIASCSNDLWTVAAPNPNFTTLKTTLKSIMEALLAAGIVPVLWCVPPNTYAGGAVTPANYQANIHQWNTWIRRYASLNGFPVIDAHMATAAIDGTYISSLGSGDLIHPSPAGERAIAQQAIADGLPDIFPPNTLVHTARQTNDLSNLFNDGTTNLGLFTVDSNSDGVANGLSVIGGTATYSVVAPASSDNLSGNWQQATATTGQTAALYAAITTGWSVGDVIAFSARFQTQGVDASSSQYSVAVVTDTPGGYTPPGGTSQTALGNGLSWWQSDIEDGELYIEFPVISQMTDMYLIIQIESVASGTTIFRVGEVTIRNLTTGGLLV